MGGLETNNNYDKNTGNSEFNDASNKNYEDNINKYKKIQNQEEIEKAFFNNEVDQLIAPENISIEENEDKDLTKFFYIKGSGQQGDIIIAKTDIRGPSPVYRYNENTHFYDCVNYSSYKNIEESKIKEMKSKYPRHEITDQEEPKGKEKIPADLEAQLNKINYKELFVTGDGKLFNIVHDNRMQISDESVKIFKDKLNQYANENSLQLPHGFTLKPVTENGIKEFEIWYSTGTNSSSRYPTAITFGP